MEKLENLGCLFRRENDRGRVIAYTSAPTKIGHVRVGNENVGMSQGYCGTPTVNVIIRAVVGPLAVHRVVVIYYRA